MSLPHFCICSSTFSVQPLLVRPSLYIPTTKSKGGRVSIISIRTCYGLVSLGFEPLWRRDFPHLSKTSPEDHPASCTTDTGAFSPRIKQKGCSTDHPPASSAEVKERLGLYLRSPFIPSWHVIGRPFPLQTHSGILYGPLTLEGEGDMFL
jgi:hypothetical protein